MGASELKTEDAARQLNVSPSYIRGLCREGVLDCRKGCSHKKTQRGEPYLGTEEWDVKDLTYSTTSVNMDDKCEGVSIGKMRLDLYAQTDINRDKILGWSREKTKAKWVICCK